MNKDNDIEDLKHQHGALIERYNHTCCMAERYKSSFENSRDAMNIFSLNQKILDVNFSLVRLSQYSREDLLAMPLSNLFPEILTDKGARRMDLLRTKTELSLFETFLLTKNKKKIPVEIVVTFLENIDEKEIICQGNIRNISQRKQALNKLKKNQEKYLSLIENLDAGISRSTPGLNGRFIEVNKAIVKILGYPKEELFKSCLFKFYTDPKQAHEVYKKIERDGCIKEKEISIIHRDGSHIVVSYTGKSVKDVNGQINYIDDILVDITTRKKTEEEIQRNEKLKSIGALAGGIAHNFNNIMTSLFGYISLARMDLEPERAASQYLKKAEHCMQEGIKLTKQLLTFAKGGSPIKEYINIIPFIRDTAMFNLSGSNIRFNFSPDMDLWQISIDRSQISQVISNIVMNARQAMPKGGKLEIRIEKSNLLKDNLLTISKGKYIKITITDTGPGIPQKNLEEIFDPYFTTRENGTGMGLSICYSIVKKHNGYISASSQIGTGTSITIYLPAVSPRQKKESKMKPATTEASLNNPLRILVMDDEDHIRNISKKMLEKFGYLVELASDGEDAISQYKALLENNTPAHLVIMDLTIPGGMGGEEASKIILDIDPNAKIVVSSGYSDDPIMTNFKEYGLKGIIPKPFRLEELKRSVKQFLTEIAS